MHKGFSFAPLLQSITPTWVVTKEGSGKVSTVSPLMMTLDLTIPQNTAGKYALEVLAPFSDSAAIFQVSLGFVPR